MNNRQEQLAQAIEFINNGNISQRAVHEHDGNALGVSQPEHFDGSTVIAAAGTTA